MKANSIFRGGLKNRALGGEKRLSGKWSQIYHKNIAIPQAITVISAMMSDCQHYTWLRVTSRKEISIYNPDWLGHILPTLTNPLSQYPSLIFFIGKKLRILLCMNSSLSTNLVRVGATDLLICESTIRQLDLITHCYLPIVIFERLKPPLKIRQIAMKIQPLSLDGVYQRTMSCPMYYTPGLFYLFQM